MPEWVIDPTKVTREDVMRACNENVILHHVRELWLQTHQISFEQALSAAVLLLAEENAALREDMEPFMAQIQQRKTYTEADSGQK